MDEYCLPQKIMDVNYLSMPKCIQHRHQHLEREKSSRVGDCWVVHSLNLGQDGRDLQTQFRVLLFSWMKKSIFLVNVYTYNSIGFLWCSTHSIMTTESSHTIIQSSEDRPTHFTYACMRVIVRRAGLLWSQQDFEWLWSVPLSSASLY